MSNATVSQALVIIKQGIPKTPLDASGSDGDRFELDDFAVVDEE